MGRFKAAPEAADASREEVLMPRARKPKAEPRSAAAADPCRSCGKAAKHRVGGDETPLCREHALEAVMRTTTELAQRLKQLGVKARIGGGELMLRGDRYLERDPEVLKLAEQLQRCLRDDAEAVCRVLMR